MMMVMVMLEDIIYNHIRTYANDSQGTINYSTGEIILNSLNVASISNIRGIIYSN